MGVLLSRGFAVSSRPIRGVVWSLSCRPNPCRVIAEQSLSSAAL